MQAEGWLARAARVRPEASALETPEGGCSYAELYAQARSAANALKAAGVTPGDRVAIALPGGLAFARALHACMLLSAVAVPVDVRLGEAERAQVCHGATVVIDEPLPAEARPDRTDFGVREDFAASKETEREPRREGASGGHDLDATAVVIHTSGTSSAPKPIELTYGNLLWSALGSAVALGLDENERWLCALPVSHVGGLSILVRSAIYATTAVLHPRFETERALEALREHEITLVSLVATTLARLLDAGLADPPALRCALTGGGPVAPALIERAAAHGVPVRLTYGLTEACSQVTTDPLASSPTASQGRSEPNAGPPLFCTDVRIAADGEVLVTGATVAPGALARDGWLHTGDLGALDGEGRLRILGRIADTIVSGGENVAPAEVEAVLEAHPEVAEAAVTGRPDATWGEAVTALIVPREGSLPDAEKLRAHCIERLAPYKVPKRYELLGEPLPRTRSGKLLRREL